VANIIRSQADYTDLPVGINPVTEPAEGYEEFEKRTREGFEEREAWHQSRAKKGAKKVRRGVLGTGIKDYTGRLRSIRHEREMGKLLGERETGLEQKDTMEYDEATRTKPKFVSGVENPASYTHGTYETYAEALANWTEKNKVVLGRGEERFEQSTEEIEEAQEELRNIAKGDFGAAIQAMPLGVGEKREEFIPKMNAWVSGQASALGREDYYDVSTKILEGTLSKEDLKTQEGKEAVEKNLEDVKSFTTIPNYGNQLISGRTESHPQYFTGHYGWVYRPYLVGEYKVLDPKTMKVKVYDAKKTGDWITVKGTYYEGFGKNRTRHKYSADRPKIETSLVSEYTIPTPTALSKALLFQEGKKTWGYKSTEGDRAGQQYRQRHQDYLWKEQQKQQAYLDLARLVDYRKAIGEIPRNVVEANPWKYGKAPAATLPTGGSYSSLYQYQALNPATKISYGTIGQSYQTPGSLQSVEPGITRKQHDTLIKAAKLSGSGFKFSEGFADKFAGIFR